MKLVSRRIRYGGPRAELYLKNMLLGAEILWPMGHCSQLRDLHLLDLTLVGQLLLEELLSPVELFLLGFSPDTVRSGFGRGTAGVGSPWGWTSSIV